MVQPVHTLTVAHTAQDAALLMSRHGIRHVPVTRNDGVAGLVSERDLFAMQRLSLKQVSTSIRAAADVATLQLVAQDIRRFARNLLSQGVQARQLTALISHLNDVLTQRLLELKARSTASRWRASAGWRWAPRGARADGGHRPGQRADPARRRDRGAARAALGLRPRREPGAGRVRLPLCRGGIMAGEPACCLTLREWRERFSGGSSTARPRTC